MKPKLKFYLDTSILSAYYDFSKPMRQHMTEQWFIHESKSFRLYISTVTTSEINHLLNTDKRKHIIGLISKYSMSLLDTSETSNKLADFYMKKGAIPHSEPEDASHIAIALEA